MNSRCLCIALTNPVTRDFAHLLIFKQQFLEIKHLHVFYVLCFLTKYGFLWTLSGHSTWTSQIHRQTPHPKLLMSIR